MSSNNFPITSPTGQLDETSRVESRRSLRVKADDPQKDQSRRSRSKADDPWVKADDPSKSRRSFAKADDLKDESGRSYLNFLKRESGRSWGMKADDPHQYIRMSHEVIWIILFRPHLNFARTLISTSPYFNPNPFITLTLITPQP